MGQYKIGDIEAQAEIIKEAAKRIKDSINNKGVDLPDGVPFEQYSQYIDEIPTGGSTLPSVDNTSWYGSGPNPANPDEYVSIVLEFIGETHTMKYLLLTVSGEWELQSETPYTQNGSAITAMYGSWTMEMFRYYELGQTFITIEEYPDLQIYFSNPI